MGNFNYAESRALHEQRAQARDVAVRCISAEKITAETRSTYEKAMAEVDKLTKRIAALDGTSSRGIFSGDVDWNQELVMGRYLRGGKDVLTPEEFRSLRRETRAELEGSILGRIGTYTGLAYFIPQGFRNEIEQATKYYCPFLDGSASGVTIMETDSGQPLPMPTSNDTAAVATIVGEGSVVTEADVTAAQINLGAYKFSSGLVQVSIETMQDSAFDLEAWLGQRFGERFGRAIEAYLTTGTGSGQPTGILTAIEACGVAPIIAAGSSLNDGSSATGATSIGSQDIVNLEHGVDPTYRRNARYMMHDITLGSLQKLLDKYGRPLWTPSMSQGAPNLLNGYPVVVNQSMPQVAAGQNTVVFGDFSKFIVRKVKNLTVQRLDERYAELGLVAFLSFARVDSNLLDAGMHPLNVLEQHS
jgi:HK97 family phage major capsid protein